MDITTYDLSMRTLSDIMDFDHVIQVHADGTVTDARGVYAPEAYDWGDELVADIDTDALERAGWSLMDGYSGQYSYSGPWMHASEYIGGRLERDILATPGYYVAIYPHGDEDPDTWAVAYRETLED